MMIAPRLHVILRAGSPTAVVVRRGPGRRVCTLGWDLATDRFTVGQWLAGRLYAYRSDLSPDGRFLIYFAANYAVRDPNRTAWTGVSKAPCLKALDLWMKGDAWNGGGLFAAPNAYWLNDGYGHRSERRSPLLRRVEGFPHPEFGNPRQWGSECLGVYIPRLLREGWLMEGWHHPGPRTRVAVFAKPLGRDGRLEKSLVATNAARAAGQGVYSEWHRLTPPGGHPAEDHPDWEWAEVDRDRVVWAAGGCLHAARIGASGMGPTRPLADLTVMAFTPIAAPY